jgi:hypothetical protein
MTTATWVLGLMLATQPTAPWSDTYAATAEAIADEANAHPLAGGPAHTAALLVAVAWYESTFKPDASGDCTDGGSSVACSAPRAVPHSFCLMQIHESNLRGLGTTRAEVMTDVRACVRAGLRMITESLRVCRSAPARERLRWYAGGGPVCTATEDAKRKSAHRMALTEKLLRDHPVDA